MPTELRPQIRSQLGSSKWYKFVVHLFGYRRRGNAMAAARSGKKKDVVDEGTEAKKRATKSTNTPAPSAKKTKPEAKPRLTAHQKMLLERQKGLLHDLATKGSQLNCPCTHAREEPPPMTREKVIEILKRIGVLTPTGRLSKSYR